MPFGSSGSHRIAVWSGRLIEMAVQAIRGDVELAVGEPAHVQVVRVEARVLDLRERLRPGEPLAALACSKTPRDP